MEWNVKTVDVHPNEEGHDDVIYNVHWSVSKVSWLKIVAILTFLSLF